MIRQEIDIDGWWLVTVFYLPCSDNLAEVTEAYEDIGCPYSDVVTIRRIVGRLWNRGATYSSGWLRHSVVVIGRATSWSQFFDTMLHELKHVVDDVVMWYDLENLGEPPAYLQGELGRQMAPVVRRIACPCCGLEIRRF